MGIKMEFKEEKDFTMRLKAIKQPLEVGVSEQALAPQASEAGVAYNSLVVATVVIRVDKPVARDDEFVFASVVNTLVPAVSDGKQLSQDPAGPATHAASVAAETERLTAAIKTAKPDAVVFNGYASAR